MALRPIYVPLATGNQLVQCVEVDFVWVAGMAASQKKKSIRSLHAAALQRNITNILEISSKSEDLIGVQLSAFNLKVTLPSGSVTTVENAFQAGKVFQNGGPYQDLLAKTPREAKADPRLTTSGPLVGFSLEGKDWPTQPQTAFYDWLYVSALKQTPILAAHLAGFGGFSDIEFNPKRSINCQAHAAALFVALSVRGELEAATKDREAFIRCLTLHSTSHPSQGRFF